MTGWHRNSVSENQHSPPGSLASNDHGHPGYRLQRPAAYEFASLASWNPDWVHFGTLFHHTPFQTLRLSLETIRQILSELSAGHYYDVNLRQGEHTPELLLSLANTANI